MQLTTHQPPIPKTTEAAAWSQRYIGYERGITEGSHIGFIAVFRRLKSWTIPLAKVVNFKPLGALFALGGLEADLTPIWRSHRRRVSLTICIIVRERNRFFTLERSMNSPHRYFCNVTQTFRLHDHIKKSQTLNISLVVLHVLQLTRRWNSRKLDFHNVTRTFGITVHNETIIIPCWNERNYLIDSTLPRGVNSWHTRWAVQTA